MQHLDEYEAHVDVVIYIITALLGIYGLLILVRVVLSWIHPKPDGPVFRALRVAVVFTEPYLRVFRYILPVPRYGWPARRDFSSLLGLIVLFVAAQVLTRV